MAAAALDKYLNDHLAGAMMGSALARQIRSRSRGTSPGELMASLAPQIEADRQSLIELMRRVDSPRRPVRQAQATRIKFWGPTAGAPELGTFLALESLALGVQGKLSLWKALEQVADGHPAIASEDLAVLIERAESQYDALERERLAAGRRALRRPQG
jgi:hypothetical protein